jgi:hypothetical protein
MPSSDFLLLHKNSHASLILQGFHADKNAASVSKGTTTKPSRPLRSPGTGGKVNESPENALRLDSKKPRQEASLRGRSIPSLPAAYLHGLANGC